MTQVYLFVIVIVIDIFENKNYRPKSKPMHKTFFWLIGKLFLMYSIYSSSIYILWISLSEKFSIIRLWPQKDIISSATILLVPYFDTKISKFVKKTIENKFNKKNVVKLCRVLYLNHIMFWACREYSYLISYFVATCVMWIVSHMRSFS